jgi:uncharacterized protein YjiS (DUF1127 family)
MARSLRKPLPGIVAAHLAAFTTVPTAPEPHAVESFHRRGQESEVVHPQQWWRTPAIVMRGWLPRAVEPRLPWRERLGAAVAAIVGAVKEWHERARSRQLLLRLDDRTLADIGLDRASAEYEASLPFWHERR